MDRCFHSVKVDRQKCEGCATCVERCPMNAIRLHDGKAEIVAKRCIDCGECIRTCPNQAKIVVADTLEKLSGYTYRIALLAPSLQVFLDTEGFPRPVSFEDVRDVFLNMGFNEVFEVSPAAEVVSFVTAQHILQEQPAKPLFSSSCPAVLRLIQLRFPELLKHAAPVLSPMEVASRLAKEVVMKRTGIPYGEIAAFFISPCPAKITETRQPILTTHSSVDAVIGVNQVYGIVVSQLSRKDARKERAGVQKTTEPAINVGRFAEALQGADVITRMKVSGIYNVVSLLQQIERGRSVNVDFIELLACTGGCLGGPLNTRNPFEGYVDLKALIEKYRVKQRFYDHGYLLDIYNQACFASTGPSLPPSAPDERVESGR